MLLDLTNRPLARCPLCGGLSFTVLNKNDRYLMGLTTAGCETCGLVQTNPRPTHEELSKFYQEEYRKFYQGIDSPDAAYVKEQKKQERMQATFEFLKSFEALKESTPVVDVGCSEGTFFATLRRNGCAGSFLGVEPGDAFAKHAARIPDTSVVSSMSDITGMFGLASMIHVLEHQSDPLEALISLRRSLLPSGFLYLDIPDADEYKNIDALHLAHIFHFSTRTIVHLVKRAGFDIVHLERYSPVNHPASIRLLARPSSVALTSTDVSSKTSELPTWSKISHLSSSGKTVRHFLRKIPGLKFVYRFIRRTIRH